MFYQFVIPEIVFEINGQEHYTMKKRIQSDEIKRKLLNSKGIRLVFIPNYYVKNYEFIRELIKKLNGDTSSQINLFDGYDS